MKVNIYETVEVSDDQRVAIARHFDGDGAKKRQATRDELKQFIWDEGSNWEDALDRPVDSAPAEGTDTDPEGPENGSEDLLGTDDGDDEDLI